MAKSAHAHTPLHILQLPNQNALPVFFCALLFKWNPAFQYGQVILLLHFVAFFHVASLLSTGVENRKVGVDNKKALELTNALFSIGVDNRKALELTNGIIS